MNIGTGVGDRFGGLRELAAFVFFEMLKTAILSHWSSKDILGDLFTWSCSGVLFFVVRHGSKCTKLTAKDATDAKTLANAMSPRPESNGRCPGPSFIENEIQTLFCLPEQSWD